MGNFDSLFPTFKTAVQDLHDGLLVFAFIIMVLGLLIAAYRGMFGNLVEVTQAMTAIAILTVVLNYVDDWTFEIGNLINEHVIGELGSDPRETHTRFGELITEPEEDADQSWYEEIFALEASIAKALGYFLIWLAAKVAWLIVWWAYFIQKALLYFGMALSPIFLPMFLLNATRGIMVRYVLGLISLLVWPLGWAVANLMTDSLLQAGADNTIFEYGGALGQATYGPQMIFFLLLASLWLVFSTIAAPVMLGKVIASGAQIGAALLGGFGSSLMSGASGAAGGAAAASGAGGGALGMMAGGAAGGGAGVIGASMGSGSLATGAGLAALSSAGGGGGGGVPSEAGSAAGGGSTATAGSGSGGGGGGAAESGAGEGPGGNNDYNSKAAAIAAAN
ncbi:MAG: hypothetical protein O3C21_16885 [Verrucomicrobia bacterium]|nr:hypothetical protein [Verrucomicrobiota bacterium]